MSAELLRSLPILIGVALFVGVGIYVGLSLQKERASAARK